MKPSIEMNTKIRQRPNLSDFAENLFKLLNNDCFGKTIEILRRTKNLIIVTNTEQAKHFCKKFNFKRFKIFKEDLVGVTRIKKKIKWNNPTYLGAAILDISKLNLKSFTRKTWYRSMVREHGFL